MRRDGTHVFRLVYDPGGRMVGALFERDNIVSAHLNDQGIVGAMSYTNERGYKTISRTLAAVLIEKARES